MGSPKESNLKPSLPKLLKSTFKSFFISKNTGSNTAKRKIFGSKNVKSDPAKCDPIKSDPVKYDPVKSDPVKYDPVKSDPAKSEPVKIESPQRERLSADTLHTRKDTNKIKLDISKPHSPAVRIDSNESEKESNLAFGSRKSNKTDKQSHLTFASHRSINEKDTNDVNKNVDSDFTFSNTKIATKSQLSNDSGFGELASFADLKISPCVKNDDFLEETLKNLTLEGTCDETKNKKTHKSKSKKELNTKDDDKDLTKENEKEAKTAKKKHARTFYVRRGLTPHKPKHRQNSRAATDPYPHEITQINEKILSGGQMIIVSEEKHDFKSSFLVAPTWPDPSEIKINDVKVSLEIALNDAYSETQPVENADLDDCMKILNDKISPEVANELMQYAGMNVEQTFVFNYAAGFPNTANEVVYANEYEFTQSLSPQYDFSSPANDYTNSPNSALSKSPLSELSLYHMSTKEQFLTPPCSNESQTLHSPSQSYISPCTPPNLDAFSSPNHISSPEKTYMYTTILNQDGDAPQIVIDDTIQDDKKDFRLHRGSSLNMSAIKKHLSMIAAKFAAKDCCQKGRKAPKDEMSEYLEKCTKEQRKAMCLNIARLEFDKLFDVLYFNILLALERPAGENDALNLSLFNLICQRLLAEKPEVFLHQNYGLALLVRASMRCPARPLLTRYLVWCVRCALRAQPARPGPVFTQTDSEGETLASALARRGDATADCLAELVARGKTEPPLFDLEHRNTEGYTALHVACQLHNAASLPTLHTVHALLAHGRAPRTLTDNKASNTPLHCAADSRGCELPLILTIFHDVPRTDWKPLAHAKNASQHTPLDVARAAFKSTSRPNYPKDVLEFLQRAARMP